MVKPVKGATAAQPAVPDRVEAPGTRAGAKKPAARSRGPAKQHDERARDSRAQETREEDFGRVDEDAPYVRPSSLEAPQARPGYEQRWVHVGMEKPDEKNAARRLREGWRPRPSNTVPKGFHVPRIAHGRFSGFIGVEGMVLMEIPVKMAKKRRAFFDTETQKRTRAIDDDLRRANAGAQTGGFGPITRAQRSQLVRDPTKKAGGEGADAGEGDEVTL